MFLVHNRERVVSKDDLIAGICGGRIVSESAVTTRINAARRAVGDSGVAQAVICTVVRMGVRFVAEVQEHGALPRPPVSMAAARAEAPTLFVKPAYATPNDDPTVVAAREKFHEGPLWAGMTES